MIVKKREMTIFDIPIIKHKTETKLKAGFEPFGTCLKPENSLYHIRDSYSLFFLLQFSPANRFQNVFEAEFVNSLFSFVPHIKSVIIIMFNRIEWFIIKTCF